MQIWYNRTILSGYRRIQSLIIYNLRQEDITKSKQLSERLKKLSFVSNPKKKPVRDLSFLNKLSNTSIKPKVLYPQIVERKIVQYTGRPGINGKDGVDGKDGKNGKDGRDGRHGLNGINGKDGIKGKDAVEIESQDLINKINSLEGVIEPKVIKDHKVISVDDVIKELKSKKGNDRLDISNIRNGEQLAALANKKKIDTSDERWHGGGLSIVSHDTSLTGQGTPSSPLSVVPGGSTIVYNDTVSGTINGTNRVFTVPNAINYPITLFLANSSYQSGVDYTVTGANQITYTVAPDASLSGQPHWLAHI